MMDIDALFKRRKLNAARLPPFGFVKNKNGYTYSTHLIDGQFDMTVTVTKEGFVSTELVDTSTGESYVLHRISSATGAFVGRVREEHDQVLEAIANACFEPDVFKSEGAKRIIKYIREKYQDELEFLWPRFPDNAIFRRQDSAKWYAALLTVQKGKLGLSGDDPIEIIDLRMKPEDVNERVDNKRYFPGFHMNKKHWVTICLDDSVPLEEIFCRIDESYALAVK
ncbi:MmcQ/YjbR family DNA-binding protein [Leminorella grimontii]|uniref:MmcQ/YjbR family DNA-binding protein n=1 Tax=Leminorella grimontii TaxID=82981 RepID=UPI0020820504|nr:MmcQ/YjbR family DNA-binding protein [Leminorella grimontii]GKX57956.1 hypothetical protein SOASR031_02710 [Leminorella grimontii]